MFDAGHVVRYHIIDGPCGRFFKGAVRDTPLLWYDIRTTTMQRFINYLHDTRGELKHVSWPTQRQTIMYTILVVLISVVTSVYLGLLDMLFTKGLRFLVG